MMLRFLLPVHWWIVVIQQVETVRPIVSVQSICFQQYLPTVSGRSDLSTHDASIPISLEKGSGTHTPRLPTRLNAGGRNPVVNKINITDIRRGTTKSDLPLVLYHQPTTHDGACPWAVKIAVVAFVNLVEWVGTREFLVHVEASWVPVPACRKAMSTKT